MVFHVVLHDVDVSRIVPIAELWDTVSRLIGNGSNAINYVQDTNGTSSLHITQNAKLKKILDMYNDNKIAPMHVYTVNRNIKDSCTFVLHWLFLASHSSKTRTNICSDLWMYRGCLTRTLYTQERLANSYTKRLLWRTHGKSG